MKAFQRRRRHIIEMLLLLSALIAVMAAISSMREAAVQFPEPMKSGSR